MPSWSTGDAVYEFPRGFCQTMASVPVRSPSRPSLMAMRLGLRKPLMVKTRPSAATGCGMVFWPRPRAHQMRLPVAKS